MGLYAATRNEPQKQDSLGVRTITYNITSSIEPYLAVTPPFEKTGTNRHAMFSSYPTANGFDVHLASIRSSFKSERIEGKLGFMAGSFAMRNMQGVPATLQYIQEASVHLALNKSKTWITGLGIQPSHIGSENMFGFENMLLTRSLAADNSPYFQNGWYVKWAPSGNKFSCSLWALNGWQTILPSASKIPIPAGGWQVLFKPNEALTINSSSYFGQVPNGTIESKRLFHNLYLKGGDPNKFEWMICFDAGLQFASTQRKIEDNYWSSMNVNCNIHQSEKYALQIRAEVFQDPSHIFLNLPGRTKNVLGFTLGHEIKINSWCMFRNEAKAMLFEAAPTPNHSENVLGYFTCGLMVFPTLYKK